MNYLYIFFQSCLLEIPFYLLVARGDWKKLTAFIFSLNSITHPIVFFGLMNLPMTFLQNILIAEAFAIVSEAFALSYFLKVRGPRALLASFVSNLVSWQLGPVLTYALF